MSTVEHLGPAPRPCRARPGGAGGAGAADQVTALVSIAAARNELERATRRGVTEARRRGATWGQVADALGLPSAEAAEFSFGIVGLR